MLKLAEIVSEYNLNYCSRLKQFPPIDFNYITNLWKIQNFIQETCNKSFQQESRKMNYEQVVEEDRRSKLPKNYDLKRKRQEWELAELEAREVCWTFNISVDCFIKNIIVTLTQSVALPIVQPMETLSVV